MTVTGQSPTSITSLLANDALMSRLRPTFIPVFVGNTRLLRSRPPPAFVLVRGQELSGREHQNAPTLATGHRYIYLSHPRHPQPNCGTHRRYLDYWYLEPFVLLAPHRDQHGESRFPSTCGWLCHAGSRRSSRTSSLWKRPPHHATICIIQSLYRLPRQPRPAPSLELITDISHSRGLARSMADVAVRSSVGLAAKKFHCRLTTPHQVN
jgi:hypothetical protein